MKISRTAFVARTAHDQTHGNKLIAPEFGIVEIRLKKGDSKKSKSYLPESSTPRRKPTDGGEDEFCFAPGTQWKEDTWAEDKDKTDKVTVWYHLYNPFSVIAEAKLELFRRFDKKAFWERELKDDELLDGEHELEFEYGDDKKKEKLWDGSLGKESDEFPDGFVTTEHSPYKLRLTVKGEGICKSPMAWTYFHILIEKLELEWGDLEAIPDTDAKKRQPFKDLKAAAAKPTDGTDGTPSRIYLISNLYKRSEGEMFNNTLYDEYKNLWEDGPQIPVYAKIWVRDSGGTKVVAPKALGGTKFLWDWESKLDKTNNKFVDNAQDYYKEKTKPKGQNCHKDRGGKRGDSTKLIFPKQTGYDPADTLTDGSFPFEVKQVGTNRKWASYSKAWRKGKLAGKTGVLFQPARTAGDKYQVTVYAAHELKDSSKEIRIDVDRDAPIPIDDKLKAKGGIWQVWRKLHFRRYMTKAGGTSTVGWPGVKAYYEPAFVDIESKASGIETYPASEWNSAVTNVRNGWNLVDQLKVDATTDQHAAGKHGIHFRELNEFKAAIISGKHLKGYKGGANKWLRDNNLDTDEAYATECQDLALNALISIFDSKMPADDGIALFQVELSINENLIAAMSSFTDGQAADFPSGSRNKCAFLWTAPASLYTGGIGPEATPAHEIGHHMFLPHPRNTAENSDASANNDYNAHDRSVNNCLMSYLDATRELCGFCQLRQRGWDKSKLNPSRPHGAKNKKT